MLDIAIDADAHRIISAIWERLQRELSHRVASLVLLNLEAQESVDGFNGLFVRGGNYNTPPIRSFLERILNIYLLTAIFL